jgi:hypothetical protein
MPSAHPCKQHPTKSRRYIANEVIGVHPTSVRKQTKNLADLDAGTRDIGRGSLASAFYYPSDVGTFSGRGARGLRVLGPGSGSLPPPAGHRMVQKSISARNPPFNWDPERLEKPRECDKLAGFCVV